MNYFYNVAGGDSTQLRAYDVNRKELQEGTGERGLSGTAETRTEEPGTYQITQRIYQLGIYFTPKIGLVGGCVCVILFFYRQISIRYDYIRLGTYF